MKKGHRSAMELKGKAALVTGGAVRMGAAICARLAGEGADVVIHYRASADKAAALKTTLARKGARRVELASADLSSEQDCRSLIAGAREAMGRLDILINNAATFQKDALMSVTSEKLLGAFLPNLFAPLFLMQAFASVCDSGKIVNVLDRRIVADDTSCVPYLLSKQGLASLTRLAALTLAPGISVNGVAPGAILPPPGEGGAYLKEHGGRVPLARQCTAEEIADAIVFLLRNDAITGQVIFVDGGQHLLGAAADGRRGDGKAAE